MPTEQEYAEADAWLARQMDECVHNWKYEQGGPTATGVMVFPFCTCTKCGLFIDRCCKALNCKPRARNLGEMVNAAHKIREKKIGKHIGHCFSIQFYDGDDVVFVGELKEYYKDHPSPQKAGAWCLYRALKESTK